MRHPFFIQKLTCPRLHDASSVLTSAIDPEHRVLLRLTPPAHIRDSRYQNLSAGV